MKEEKSKKEVINVNINVESIMSAARNSDDLETAVLEIETVNPRKITLEQDLYMLKAVPVNDNQKLGKKTKEFVPKMVGIKSFTVNSLATGLKEGYITINGTIDIPKSGNRTVKLEECLFASESEARTVARVLTEVELEKVTEAEEALTKAKNTILKQLEDDRF